MELIEAIKQRHSVRQYLDKEIPQDIIAELQAEMMLATKTAVLTFSLLQTSQKHLRAF